MLKNLDLKMTESVLLVTFLTVLKIQIIINPCYIKLTTYIILFYQYVNVAILNT